MLELPKVRIPKSRVHEMNMLGSACAATIMLVGARAPIYDHVLWIPDEHEWHGINALELNDDLPKRNDD